MRLAYSSPRRRRPATRSSDWRLALFGGALLGLVAGWQGSAMLASAPIAAENVPATSPQFGLCHSGGGHNCVVDGDTFWLEGERIRIADIDAPETHPSRCPYEADLGGKATRQLQALLNAGPVTLILADRDTDRYGRKLRIVLRDGESIGGMLVDEGLARRWTGHRQPWC